MNSSDVMHLLTAPAPVTAAQDVLPTGSVSLDVLLGGGWPAGCISEVCGPPGYADPLAYRTIAAVQHAHPGRPAVLCTGSFSLQLARKYGVDNSRLMVTSIPGQAVSAIARDSPSIAVIDRPFGTDMPVRADKLLSVLCLTADPGDARSAACIRLAPYGGARGWAWAERMWTSLPRQARFSSMLACFGDGAFTQELLDTAALLDVVTARGRRYSYGTRQIGGGWQAAVAELNGRKDLRDDILAEVAHQVPVYPGWAGVYA